LPVCNLYSNNITTQGQLDVGQGHNLVYSICSAHKGMVLHVRPTSLCRSRFSL